jgi:homoserine O-acetyltransferase
MNSPRSVVVVCNATSRIFARPASTILSSRDSRRILHLASRKAAATPATSPDAQHAPPELTKPGLPFPCLDVTESQSVKLHRRSLEGGPEPSYNVGKHLTYHSYEPLLLDWGGVLPEFSVAYETWGTPNSSKSNVILLHTGLSASSHAHSTPENPKPGWWEKFIGPGKPLDTDSFFIICTNVIGGCYGSTGPASIDPTNGERYATRFPILTMEDMVRAQFRLLDALGIEKLYASVGSSMGGMQSLAAACLFPERVSKVVSISGCARSHPYSIAMRHTQRQVLMMDPNWKRGFYYDSVPPHMGMKMAREIATVTYRSGPEWEQRFGRRRADPSKPPALCPDFLVETYLEHAGEKFRLEYDPNSLLYVSKAMDIFDLGHEHRQRIATLRSRNAHKLQNCDFGSSPRESNECILTLPEKPYEEQPEQIHNPVSQQQTGPFHMDTTVTDPPAQRVAHEPPQDLIKGMQPMSHVPTLVLGVASDILFPSWQQREIAETLKRTGNREVWHIELGEEKSLFGHDTFLLDLENVGGVVGAFLR